jgi:ABC-type lipoprotein release transport system permease subunit
MLAPENLYLLKFAWKSVRRNAGRSFFIGFSVSLAVMIAVWVVAFFDGLNHQIEEAVVNTNTGYVQLQDPLYAKSTDSSRPLVFSEELKKLLQDKRVISYSPELVLDGNISTPEGAAGLLVLGVDPALHAKFMPIASKIKSGTYLDNESSDGVIIGGELARLFKFKVGDQLVMNYQDRLGELRSELLNIRGIYNYNSQGFEKRFVYVNQRTLQTLYLGDVQPGILFNRIPIRSKNFSKASELIPLVPESIKTKTWKQLNPEMAVVLDFHEGMIRFFFLIIGATILMTILTPVQMLWQERLKEFRSLTTLGVTIRKFWKIGLFEVFLMIILSTLFSIVLLTIIIGIQSKTGVDFRFLGSGIPIERSGIKLPGIIYPLLTVNQLLITFGFVIFVLGTSYVWSIHRLLLRLKVEQ